MQAETIVTITSPQQNHPTMPVNRPKQDYADIKKLVEAEMAEVNQLIIRELSSDVVLINQIGNYIVTSGGKRLRPVLLLLVAKALGYREEQHITLAAVIEFIHTATLLHDDVVDESSKRRGQDTVNELWGNQRFILKLPQHTVFLRPVNRSAMPRPFCLQSCPVSLRLTWRPWQTRSKTATEAALKHFMPAPS